jgi:hypothetical protein
MRNYIFILTLYLKKVGGEVIQPINDAKEGYFDLFCTQYVLNY